MDRRARLPANSEQLAVRCYLFPNACAVHLSQGGIRAILKLHAGDPRAEAKLIMINLTSVAASKVKEIMAMQSPVPTALRVAVVGGGCSGFQYHMAFENQTNETDEVIDFAGLKVAVDQMSSMYLEGVEIDYVETLEGAGFKFNNPNVKSTCGCGSSFSV